MRRFFFVAAMSCHSMFAQVTDEPVVLTIDVENQVLYRANVFDLSKIAKDPAPTTSVNQAFLHGMYIADIVAINGKPVKGTVSTSSIATPFRSAPQPGQVIADFDGAATFFCTWQIYDTDGTFLGLIRDSGAGQGHSVSGGLASFFGAVGSHHDTGIIPVRQASIAEDPANRRNLGGGKARSVFYLYPRFRPGVQMTAGGPAVFHADLSQVTETNPARPGETLIVSATGLGPVKPGSLPPGAVEFSASPLQEVNAAVTVMFNGRELPVINKVGWPGQRHVYRVDFQVPSDATPGTAQLQLVATWIAGPIVTIPVAK
jgi:hypothetical protein